ncbi:small conductance calcium-activated potassium channel protein 2-like isoform X2 [Gigantopelta aegis]|nr:small conductance calcium-activated potassium channel protein 2-like isoform X2 [Gigantopelta aegis]
MSGSGMFEDPAIPLVGKAGPAPKTPVYDSTNDVPKEKPQELSKGMGYKLSRRKRLVKYRRLIVNVQFSLAILGLGLMVITNEMYINNVFQKESVLSISFKLMMSVSTVLLLVAVCAYHVVSVKLTMTDNNQEYWRLAVTPWMGFKIVIELLVCAIHPLPGKIVVPYEDQNGQTKEVSVDAILSILMILRLYMVGKFMVVNSRWTQDMSTQSIGALNKVQINTVFIFKALMSEKPGTMLIGIIGVLFIVNSWALRTCEAYYHPADKQSNILNAMWLISITFLTVGYGDITPNSNCGRFIAVETGFMGVGTTALLVAVMANKLQQTRAQRYVHTFISRIQLDKKHKNAAADVIKNVLMIWTKAHRNQLTPSKRLHYHSKLVDAIRMMRSTKRDMATIAETAVGIIEVSTSVNEVYNMAETITVEQKDIKTRMVSLEDKIDRICQKLEVSSDPD